MAHDELLKLLGTAGDPEADLSATGSGTGVAVGKDRAFRAVLRVGGDVTGAGANMVMRIQEAATVGGSYATIGTFPAVTDEQVGYVNATPAPVYDVPGEDPLVIVVNTTKDFVRADYTLTGTTPVFNDVSVELKPIPGFAARRSGVL